MSHRTKEVVSVSSRETRKMPMGGNKGFGAVPKGQKFKPGTIKRLMSYLKEYKVRLTVVVICILISAGGQRGLVPVPADTHR